MSDKRISDALVEANIAARLASEVAFIIQQAQEEGVSATRAAYRILGHLGFIRYTEPNTKDTTNAE